MAVKSESPPFTHTLSYVLLGAIALYLISNIAFVMACTSGVLTSGGAEMCGIPRSLSFVAEVIPAIYRPVEVLEQQGDQARAALVAGAYSFAWLGGIAVLLVIVTSAILAFVWADDKALQRLHAYDAENRKWVKPREHSLGLKGAWLLCVVALFLFADAYWGFFDGWSNYSNMVHVRNRDLYRLAIDWSFLLLFALMLLIAVGTRITLKAWPSQVGESHT